MTISWEVLAVIVVLALAAAYAARERESRIRAEIRAIPALDQASHQPSDRETPEAALIREVHRSLDKRLASINISIDEMKEVNVQAMESQRAFLRTLREVTGISDRAEPQAGDTERIVSRARKMVAQYGITMEEAMERARKSDVYRTLDESPMRGES